VGYCIFVLCQGESSHGFWQFFCSLTDFHVFSRAGAVLIDAIAATERTKAVRMFTLVYVALFWAAMAPLVGASEAKLAFGAPLQTISQHALPAHGMETYRNIQQGGPFPFEKDGAIFGNRERILPLQKRGYYREYTVKTPGSRNRGAKRIVCGGPATAPETCYYTTNHYASFRMIVP